MFHKHFALKNAHDLENLHVKYSENVIYIYIKKIKLLEFCDLCCSYYDILYYIAIVFLIYVKIEENSQ